MGRKIPRLRSKGSQDGGGERSLGRGPAQRRAWRVCARRGPPTVPKDEPCPRHCSREYPSSSSGEVGWPRRASRLGPQRRRPSAAAAGVAAVQRHREGPRRHGPSRKPPSSSRRAAPPRGPDLREPPAPPQATTFPGPPSAVARVGHASSPASTGWRPQWFRLPALGSLPGPAPAHFLQPSPPEAPPPPPSWPRPAPRVSPAGPAEAFTRGWFGPECSPSFSARGRRFSL